MDWILAFGHVLSENEIRMVFVTAPFRHTEQKINNASTFS